jgi:hypothetical protein
MQSYPAKQRHRAPAPSTLLALLACAVLPAAAGAQQSTPPVPAAAPSAAGGGDVPPPEQLEPGVNTSAPAAAPAAAPTTATGAAPATAPPAPAARATEPVPAAAPSAGAPPTHRPAGPAKAAPAAKPAKGPERLELETTDITGNRELPKVLYIVPWKRSDLGDLTGRPAHSLLDEVLQPLDRDVFQRENRYYDALKPDQTRKADKSPTSVNNP